jgi:hypothetical protein
MSCSSSTELSTTSPSSSSAVSSTTANVRDDGILGERNISGRRNIDVCEKVQVGIFYYTREFFGKRAVDLCLKPRTVVSRLNLPTTHVQVWCGSIGLVACPDTLTERKETADEREIRVAATLERLMRHFNGSKNPIADGRSVPHTSMSVGDVALFADVYYLVDCIGFAPLV